MCCLDRSPLTSSSVTRSASTWQGWERSVRPLMTGLAENDASSSRSAWVRRRATTPSTYRSSTRAASATVSRTPSWTSCSDSVVEVPPSLAMPTSKETRVRWEGFWKSMAMCLPWSGFCDQRPALISRARSSTRRSSSALRSATSKKSRPAKAFTEAIMIAGAPLEARFDQLTGYDRRDGQVAHRVELREAGPQPGVVPQPDHEIPAGRRIEAELRGLERQGRLVREADREAVGEPHVRPGTRLGEGHRLHERPDSAHLVPALDHDQPVAEQAELA